MACYPFPLPERKGGKKKKKGGRGDAGISFRAATFVAIRPSNLLSFNSSKGGKGGGGGKEGGQYGFRRSFCHLQKGKGGGKEREVYH